MPADVGTGTTVTFGESTGFSAELISLTWNVSRAAVDDTVMADAGGRSYRPSDLYEPGELSLVCQFNATAAINPIVVAAATAPETITVNWAGIGSSNRWTAQGFMISWDITGEIDEMMIANSTWKITDEIAFQG